MKQKTIFIAAAAGMALLFVGSMLTFRASTPATAEPVSLASQAALIRAHSPTLGAADAPVVIVEFLDPACETCGSFYPLVKEMLAANPGRIRVVLRWAPFHNGSQDVVAMLEAARRQDKFWPALEALLASQAAWAPDHTPQVALAWAQLARLGLDRDKLQADMATPEVAGLIAQDLADARTLGVTMTPEFFVNGKPLPSFGYEQLKQLVDDALRQSRSSP